MSKNIKKKVTIILCVIIIVLVILLFPKKVQYNDGGTATYTSLVYKVIIWHKSIITETRHDFKTGTEVHFFPNNFRDDSYYIERTE